MSIEADYEAACWAAIEECRHLPVPPGQRSYYPTTWANMIRRHTAVGAALLLVASGDLQSGFLKLIELGRPDLTIKASMLDPCWSDIFDRHPPEQEAARWRLQLAGIDPAAIHGATR